MIVPEFDPKSRPAFLEWNEKAEPFELEPVYFAFDKAILTEEAKNTIRKNAEWLKKNPETDAQLEGQCDERGGREYNLTLGEKRAEAVRRYLIQLGIKEERLSIVSYGAIGRQKKELWHRYRTAATFVIWPEAADKTPETQTAE